MGGTIYVTDAQGRDIKGKVRDLGPSALTLDSAALEALQADAVRLISQRGSRPIGRVALYGLGVGPGLGIAALAIAAQDPCDDCAGIGVAILGGYARLGAGPGAAIGAMMPGKTRVIYRPPGAPGAAPARLSFAPFVTSERKGFAVSVRF